MNMWNRKLKDRIKLLERRVKELEHPFTLKKEDKVFGYEVYGVYGYYCRVRGNFKVVDAYRSVDGLERYSIYSKKTGMKKDLRLGDIIIKKPKKNANTKA